jgi:type II secretion system protein J
MYTHSSTTTDRKRTSYAGFTLVELVLAMTATSLLLGAAYTAFFSGLMSYNTNAYKSEIRAVLFRSLTRILDDLKAAQTGSDAFRFQVENEEIEIEGVAASPVPNDRLLFTAATAKVNWEAKPQSDLSEVEYYIDRDEETPARWLVRRTDSPPDSRPLEGGEIHLVGPRVIGMDVSLYNGTKWVEEWDSTTELPLAIRVSLYVGPTRETVFQNRFESLTASVWLPKGTGSASTSSDKAEKGNGPV